MNIGIIKLEKQYLEYCDELEKLLGKKKPTKADLELIELIELLLDNWDRKRVNVKGNDPIELLKSFMSDHQMSNNDLAGLLDLSKGAISQILNYKRGLSKDVIRKLADTFKVTQEAFNRPYELIVEGNKGHKNEKMMNTKKELVME
jgi:HTH-type transcriptional regulator/antitoxin HigA